ncbi:MAG: hypothetical protein AAGA55_11485 [Planctomycetota bacterium]
MTAIAAIVRDGKAWVAADRQTTTGYTKQSFGSKIVEKDGLVIAWTGYAACAAAFRDRMTVPNVPEDPKNHDHWFRVQVPNAMKAAVKETGLGDDSEAMKNAGAGIIAWRDRIGKVGTFWTVFTPEHGVLADGSGGEVALGALYASQDKEPETALRGAIEAASLWSVGVGCAQRS